MSSNQTQEDVPDSFDFTDLQPKTAPVKYRQRTFELREPLAATVIAYRNAAANAMKFTDEGNRASVGDVHDADLILVAKSLFEIKQPGVYDQVSLKFVQELPYAVFKQLYQWCYTTGKVGEKEGSVGPKKDATPTEPSSTTAQS